MEIFGNQALLDRANHQKFNSDRIDQRKVARFESLMFQHLTSEFGPQISKYVEQVKDNMRKQQPDKVKKMLMSVEKKLNMFMAKGSKKKSPFFRILSNIHSISNPQPVKLKSQPIFSERMFQQQADRYIRCSTPAAGIRRSEGCLRSQLIRQRVANKENKQKNVVLERRKHSAYVGKRKLNKASSWNKIPFW